MSEAIPSLEPKSIPESPLLKLRRAAETRINGWRNPEIPPHPDTPYFFEMTQMIANQLDATKIAGLPEQYQPLYAVRFAYNYADRLLKSSDHIRRSSLWAGLDKNAQKVLEDIRRRYASINLPNEDHRELAVVLNALSNDVLTQLFPDLVLGRKQRTESAVTKFNSMWKSKVVPPEIISDESKERFINDKVLGEQGASYGAKNYRTQIQEVLPK